MQLLQFAGEGVGIGGRERRFAEAADGVEHVQRPAAFFGFDLAERFDATELRADFFRRGDQCGTGLRPVFSVCGIGFGNRNRQDACSTLCNCRDNGDTGFDGDPGLPRRNFMKAGQGDVAACAADAARVSRRSPSTACESAVFRPVKQFFLTILFETLMLSLSALHTIPGLDFSQGFWASLIQSTY